MNNKLSTNSFDDDFGFSFADETEIRQDHVIKAAADLNTELTEKIQQMYDAVIPLLKNLSKNPDQDIIKWPNRKEKIAQFKNKLDLIGGDFIKVKELK